MSYKLVLVKGDDGSPTPFALLSATPSAVFVCRPEMYDDIKAGRREPPFIGFPIGDVLSLDGEPFSLTYDEPKERIDA